MSFFTVYSCSFFLFVPPPIPQASVVFCLLVSFLINLFYILTPTSPLSSPPNPSPSSPSSHPPLYLLRKGLVSHRYQQRMAGWLLATYFSCWFALPSLNGAGGCACSCGSLISHGLQYAGPFYHVVLGKQYTAVLGTQLGTRGPCAYLTCPCFLTTRMRQW